MKFHAVCPLPFINISWANHKTFYYRIRENVFKRKRDPRAQKGEAGGSGGQEPLASRGKRRKKKIGGRKGKKGEGEQEVERGRKGKKWGEEEKSNKREERAVTGRLKRGRWAGRERKKRRGQIFFQKQMEEAGCGGVHL